MTPRVHQPAAALDAVDAYVRTHGYPPTVRDIARTVGVSPSTALMLLRELRADGLVSWVDGCPRTIHRTHPTFLEAAAYARQEITA